MFKSGMQQLLVLLYHCAFDFERVKQLNFVWKTVMSTETGLLLPA